MDLQLMKLRKLAGYKNRESFADHIGVNRYTYKSWETGAAMMNFEQACMCADALNCTTDALAGRSVDDKNLTDPYEQELVDCYRSSTVDRQERILDTARDAAAMSKDAAKCDLPASQEVSA